MTGLTTIRNGPLDGHSVRLGSIDAALCVQLAGVWHHHERDGARYRYAGPCADVGHEIVEWCNQSWHDAYGMFHRCTETGYHPRHRCCCLATTKVKR